MDTRRWCSLLTFFKFTPDLISKNELEKISVGRNELIENCVERIQNSIRNKSTSQILFIGPRGIGKSHTLLRIFYCLSNSNNVTAIRLAEEEYSISSLEDLCQRILEVLNISYSGENATAYCKNELNKLKNSGKPVVLFIENLQMLFEQIQPDLAKLRSIIQSNQNLCVVGSALNYFNLILSPDESFYKFFDIRYLQGLTEEQVHELIKKRLELSKKKNLMKDLEKHAERIKGIHLLTGGNPRLIHILSEIIVQKNTLEDLERNLLSLLDQLTPFYQAQMETLSREQRKLFDAIALSEGPLSPTEIARRLNASKTATVVTQLRRLQKSGLIENVKFTNKKGTRYQIVERLYRIWRELRSTRGANRIKLFVDFMNLWYSKAELLDELEHASKKIDKLYPHSKEKAIIVAKEMCYILNAVPDEAVIHLSQVVKNLTLLNQFDNARIEIQKTRDSINQKKNPFLQKSSDILIDIIELKFLFDLSTTNYTVKQQYIMDKINTLSKQKCIFDNKSDCNLLHMICERIANYLVAEGQFEHALHYNGIAIDCLNNTSMCSAVLNQRAYIKRFLNQHDESLTIVDKVLKHDPNNVEALYEKIIILMHLKKQDLAIKSGKQLLAQDTKYFAVAARPLIAFERGQELLALTNQYKKLILKLDPNERYKLLTMYITDVCNGLLHAIIDKNTKKRHFCTSILYLIKDIAKTDETVRGCSICAITHAKNIRALQKLISIFVEIFGSNTLEGLTPLIRALSYLADEDSTILEKLHPEMRQLVIQIIQEISPHSKINKEILDSISV